MARPINDNVRFRESVAYTLVIVAVFWAVKYFEFASSTNLSDWGILPRTLQGSLGILTSPFIHGDYFHLFSNTFPFIFSSIGTLYFYRKESLLVFLCVYLMTGILVWLFARHAYHLGASGIIYGLVSFLFFSGIFRKELPAIAVSLIVVFLYSGMLYGLFPSDEQVSWETHSLGALVGLVCAYMLARKEHHNKTEEPESVEPLSHTGTDSAVTFQYTYKPNSPKETE
jgi:membrane associated rhomboid family serine protease